MLKPERLPDTRKSSFRTAAEAPALKTEENIQLRRCPHTKFTEVDDNYLSFSIDISVLSGGSWWEGSTAVKKGLGANKVEPLNLDSEALHRLVQPLAPFNIRLGGSEADTISYLEPNPSKPNSLTLTKNQWDALHKFVQRHDLKLYFTAKYGVFDRRQHGNWDGHEFANLLAYSKERNFKIDVAELGNELNAYWIFHGIFSQPGPKNLAADYQRFSQLIKQYYPDVKIAGPGSAFWPKLGEPIAPFSNLTKSFLENITDDLDIIDWHYYPFQSRRSPVRTRTATHSSMVNPRSFHDYEKYCRLFNQWRKQYHPEAELWTGESGSAQCGGQEGISDRWASCFWWADQLGTGAKLGQKVMIRQSLIGGEYGLIDRTTLAPRPDYWLSLFWRTLMGPKVHPVESPDISVRAYCHENHLGQKTLLTINLSSETKHIQCEEFGDPIRQFELHANQLDSENIHINNMDSCHLLTNLDINHLPEKSISRSIRPLSINFWQLAN